MTYIPAYIICKDEADKIEQKRKFLQWSGGKEYHTQFITEAERIEQGLQVDEFGNVSPSVESMKEFAQALDEMAKSGKAAAEAGEALRDAFIEDMKTRRERINEGHGGSARRERRGEKTRRKPTNMTPPKKKRKKRRK